ncbi:MAG: hypothetical protein K1X85_08360 [Ignavibacteria bacterium]|nr:hypothetical protein [Ignavibacteria bacterium]
MTIRSIATLMLLFFAAAANAQRPENSVYMAGGYSFQTVTADPMNYIIDRYNETRDYLTEEMGDMSFSSGPAFSFGFGMGEDEDFILLEIGLTLGSTGNKTASGPVDGVSKTRDVKISSYYINTGFAYLLQNENKFEYGLGLYIDYGGFRVKTRLYNSNSSKPTFTDIGESQTLLAFTPTLFLDYNFSDQFGLTLRPYYRAQILTQDLAYVNEYLNPNTYRNDDPEKQKGVILSGVGAELKAIFYF